MMRGPIGGGGQQQQGANINNNTHNSNSSNSAQMHSSGGFHGPGNRSMGQRPLSMGSASPTIGQKRDSSGFSVMGGSGGSPNFHHGSPRQAAASPDSADGNFAKLFVGSVPRTVTEDDIRPLFDEHGNVLEVALIKDKRTGQQQGCCFIKYATIEEADRAIRALHNQRTLPGGIGPIQVRYADGERERLVEYKLFVGSLNKQATEKEIEEIFAPYGRVDDVYIMRDEEKQSRGCAFVKYPSRDMAMAAVTALSGIFTMKGCDQPLTVRFADPKRHKPGDTRSGPAYGGPGFGPRPHGPIGARHGSGSGGHMGGRGPHTNWRPMGTPNMGAPAHAGSRSYGSPLTPRGGTAGASSTMGGTVGGPGGPINGSLQGAGMGAPASQQQSFNPPLAHQQIQAYGQQPTSLQKPLQMQQQLAPSMQQQHQQPQQSYSQVQQSQQSIQQFGQHLQSSQPAVQQQPSLGQLSSSQQSLSLYGQPPVSQPQMQPHVSPALQQLGPNLQQQHHLPIASLQQQKQQQVPQSQPQPQVQPQPQQQQQPQQQLQQQQPPQQLQQQQPPQQLQQQQQPQQQLQQPQHISIPQQAHSAQPSFQSQQYPYLQQQHQFHLVQPAAHSQQQAQAQAQAQAQPQPQPVQTQKQQTYYQVAAQPVQQQPSWALPTQSQTVVSTPAIASAALASSATPVVPVVSAPTPAPLTCNWSEHTSPEGYKYYYNSVTGESKWEKPEEFAAYEQQQQQLQLQQAPQQPQPQPQPQVQAQPQVQSQPQPQSQVQHQPQGQAQPQVQPQSQSINQAQQLQQLQPRHQQTQLQQPALTTTYTGPGMVAHQPIQQNLGYGQLQGVNAILEPIRHQVQQHSGIPAMQDYMWKQKPAGT